MPDYAALLDKVTAAIEKVLLNQAVEYDGRKVTRANLADLQRLQTLYEGKAKRQARGGGLGIRYGVPE